MEEIKHIFKITLYEVYLKPSDNVTKIKMLQHEIGINLRLYTYTFEKDCTDSH